MNKILNVLENHLSNIEQSSKTKKQDEIYLRRTRLLAELLNRSQFNKISLAFEEIHVKREELYKKLRYKSAQTLDRDLNALKNIKSIKTRNSTYPDKAQGRAIGYSLYLTVNYYTKPIQSSFKEKVSFLRESFPELQE